MKEAAKYQALCADQRCYAENGARPRLIMKNKEAPHVYWDLMKIAPEDENARIRFNVVATFIIMRCSSEARA